MTKSLFDSFDEVSAKQWKQKIQFDLKGADYNEALIFKSLEGIDVKPFYHQEDLLNIENPVSLPTSWKNSLKIDVTDPESGNQLALKAIKKGAESIYFVIEEENIDPKNLLIGITKKTPVFFDTKFLSLSYVQKLAEVSKTSNLDIHVLTDIIGNLATTGNWHTSFKEDFASLTEIIEHKHLKSTISIDIDLYQNAGATMVQQLAYALSHANEYLNYFNSKNINPFKNSQILFKVAVGGNYFFEIAKLRALRLLWRSLAQEYKATEECHIIAYPSHRNKTILDYNVNMLRTTTECMSAILGGANTVYNIPYDDIYNLENDFGTRISLNQLLILKNESYFDIVKNPASGSYYIETLTDQLAEKALSLFKNIEEGGGFLNQLKSGTIQKKIKESAAKEQELFNNEQIILTGTNKYKNSEEITPTFQKPVFTQKKVRKTLLNPVVKRRLSDLIEKKLQ
ncbi:methylmalonyl-CoA mutase subunit beta [Aquimarina mytili]|uniref:Methylmalonyl-CoA mutase subunit beta n=1 Tax=Aquimarina mytili TaxID=874423 RepID=A0A937D6D9_9FLAO|nr:methylmalonyl-CoA mutase subunit beta [Aquimarina mytili]MBL0684294.1 methylmalonyl-CoA mutase subunit beta [Aquimarina mytili]